MTEKDAKKLERLQELGRIGIAALIVIALVCLLGAC